MLLLSVRGRYSGVLVRCLHLCWAGALPFTRLRGRDTPLCLGLAALAIHPLLLLPPPHAWTMDAPNDRALLGTLPEHGTVRGAAGQYCLLLGSTHVLFDVLDAALATRRVLHCMALWIDCSLLWMRGRLLVSSSPHHHCQHGPSPRMSLAGRLAMELCWAHLRPQPPGVVTLSRLGLLAARGI